MISHKFECKIDKLNDGIRRAVNALVSPQAILYIWSALIVMFIFNLVIISIMWMQFDYITDVVHGTTWDTSFHESRITHLEMEKDYFQVYDSETGGLKIINMSSIVIHDPPPLGTPLNPGFWR